ncbi:site-specific integrase [Aquibium oceanicum]|uniref:site-specific integrase n=1 Tax=Aquibium oceanicum TaxID=1670800 RepID=UPI0012FFA3FB|nr:site-specific integrase [Aquibium oceanicum]
MEKVTGLIRRGSTYSLRRRVPTDLVKALRKREIWIALGTTDYRVAAKEARRASVRLDLEWDRAREALKNGEPVPAQSVTDAEIRRAVLGDFWRVEQDTVTIRDDEVRENAEHDIAAYESRDPSAEAALFAQARSLINERNLGVPLPAPSRIGIRAERFEASPELVKLLELLRRADIEHLKRMLDRMDGQHGDIAHDPLFAGINSVSPRPAASEGITLGEAIKRMETDPTRAHLGDTADAKYVMTFRAMKEVIGPDMPLAAITRADCSAVQELLASIPANVTKLKAYEGCKTLRDIAARAATRNDRKMAVGTVRVYTHTLSAFFNWSINKGLLTVNPAVRLAPAKGAADISKRPFTIDEMNKIVAGLGEWSKGGALAGRRWVPLIAIFSGMRLGEIVGLTVDDIGVRDGVECFILRKTAAKSLKTPGSERVLPVHPELIRLGLLQRVANVRGEGGSRLFHDLPGSSQAELSDLFQKRFAYWQKKVLGINEPGVSFHSFRHGFRDALREAGVPIDATRAMGGWARSGGVEERYGQGTRPSTLARWMAVVKYEGLILAGDLKDGSFW